eukprot:497317-Hanusia_phi.AAC.3
MASKMRTMHTIPADFPQILKAETARKKNSERSERGEIGSGEVRGERERRTDERGRGRRRWGDGERGDERRERE